MKTILYIILPFLILTTQLKAEEYDWLDASQEEVNDSFRTGGGCDDGVHTAVSTSMIGWGVGLFVGIALLTSLVHQNAHATAPLAD